MPVVRVHYDDMERLIGASRQTIMSRLAMMGADIGKRAEEEHVDVEFFPDRPELYSAEGVARAMQGFLGIKTGLVEYAAPQGPVVLQYGQEEPHFGFVVNWEVKENVTGDFTVNA